MLEMERSWLVQRLKPPVGAAAGPFAFGGGLKNGGLSDEALDLLSDVWSFDYMGAAEFEFGAVPDTLNKIASNSKLYTGWTFTLLLSKVRKPWSKAREIKRGERATIYVISPAEWQEEIQQRITSWAASGNTGLKEPVLLDYALRGADSWYPAGWLELDNGFLFFIDEQMWRKTLDLFGLTAEQDGVDE